MQELSDLLVLDWFVLSLKDDAAKDKESFIEVLLQYGARYGLDRKTVDRVLQMRLIEFLPMATNAS